MTVCFHDALLPLITAKVIRQLSAKTQDHKEYF
jgi:hypothetical protein